MKADPKSDPAADIAKLRRHLRILVDLGRLATEATDLDRFLDQAVVLVARAVEIDHVKILRYRPATSDLLIEAGIGWRDGVVRSSTLPADLRSPPGRAFQTAEPVVVSDCGRARGFTISPLLKQHGIVSLANVPVLVDGSTWGVLEIDSATPRDFSEDTLEFLVAAGALIGTVVRRKVAETMEADRLASANSDARQLETLLREMQHRVKNSFALILSSISLQRHRFESKDVERALDHVANRINAISLAHDQLAHRDGAQVVDLAGYLRALCRSIEQQTEGVAVDVDADDIELALERAVPLGLVLNEAAINSVKHAFDDGGGRIGVVLKSGVGYGEAVLAISDNGRGIDKPREGGSGVTLMKALARQIGGALDQESSSQGTTIRLTFPIIR
ncbi:sensor histidine kinase [Alsobacter sp. SYSU BS001988]|jgi:two-component sensor histidine kinase